MGKQEEARERWSARIGAQEASGLSIRAYCKEHGIAEHSFYAWRQRVRGREDPVSFALVETKPREPEHDVDAVELIFASGERLRVPCKEAALKVVFRALR